MEIPRLALIPLGLISQVNIPGLEPIAAQANAAIREANNNTQQGLGLHDENASGLAAELQAALATANISVDDAVAGAALVTAGGVVSAILLAACLPTQE